MSTPSARSDTKRYKPVRLFYQTKDQQEKHRTTENDKVVELNNQPKDPLNKLLKQGAQDLLAKAVKSKNGEPVKAINKRISHLLPHTRFEYNS